MRLFGLIGNPLTQSFSKRYFTEKFQREDIHDCQYELFPIQSIEELPALLTAHPQLEGLNVTIPYKQQVLQYLDSRNNLPGGLATCNCIKITGSRLTGYNTDITGFEKSFQPFLKNHHTRALVLGSGGTALAVFYVLKRLGIEYEVVSRRLHTGSTLTYRDLNEKHLQDNLIIINTTPLGTFPDINNCPDIPYHLITDRHYLFDVVYNPARSLFLQKGEERGASIKNGLEMLEIQAEESWRIWNYEFRVMNYEL